LIFTGLYGVKSKFDSLGNYELINSGNACYHSVQKRLFSRLLSENVKIKIYKTIILPIVLYACETWSLIVAEEHRLKVFENRVLRRIFRPKGDEMVGGWRNCVMRNFITCTLGQV
jgi:hypothetical protein